MVLSLICEINIINEFVWQILKIIQDDYLQTL